MIKLFLWWGVEYRYYDGGIFCVFKLYIDFMKNFESMFKVKKEKKID